MVDTLILNKSKEGLDGVVIKAPGFGDRRTAILEDIAIVTGATFVTTGIDLESITLNQLGQASSVISSCEHTAIIGGYGNASTINERIEQIKNQIGQTTSEFDRQKLHERLTKLKGGIMEIRIGAIREDELNERKKCLMDAIVALRIAFNRDLSGIIDGGLVKLQKIAVEVETLPTACEPELLGKKALVDAIDRLISDSLLDSAPTNVQVDSMIREAKTVLGYDRFDEEISDKLFFGRIVPLKSLCDTIQNATNLAVEILTNTAYFNGESSFSSLENKSYNTGIRNNNTVDIKKHESVIEHSKEVIMPKIYKVEGFQYGQVNIETIEIPYRETIRKKVKVEGKHKKQSIGHGQYGHVLVEFEPYENDSFTFENKVLPGAISTKYYAAIETGLRECMSHGILSGYPVICLKATLLDGSYHDTDSSDIAFKIAAALAYKEGLQKADAILLEPIGHLIIKVAPTTQKMDDLFHFLNECRGHIEALIPNEEGTCDAEVYIPVVELKKHVAEFRLITHNTYSFEISHYEEAPISLAQSVIELARKRT